MLSVEMEINVQDIQENVSVSCAIGEIPVEGTYETIGYFKVTGTYKPGSAGRDDAEHIVGMTAYAQVRYYNRKWLFDLSELSYVWGDEMDWVLECGGGDEIVAIIVGPKCMAAISTLSNPNAQPTDCLSDDMTFDNLEAAYAYLKDIQVT
jgi:hypothetical protein